MISREAVQAALQLCRDTFEPPVPCRKPEYLRARLTYHEALYKAKRISKKELEREK